MSWSAAERAWFEKLCKSVVGRNRSFVERVKFDCFAGFVSNLFWDTIGPVGNSVINQRLINTGSEIMVKDDSVDKTGFT